mmetsp:Transcript_17048/g.34832  ORF Transcript_17048/g.34832 Transcript_17048/m.34832 type:complete len:109 (-) Transcript_17048:743-1069(-)
MEPPAGSEDACRALVSSWQAVSSELEVLDGEIKELHVALREKTSRQRALLRMRCWRTSGGKGGCAAATGGVAMHHGRHRETPGTRRQRGEEPRSLWAQSLRDLRAMWR